MLLFFMTSSHYDVIVVGGGIIGLSAAYQLSRWNKKVLLVEQYNLPHTRGSSSGGSRLIARYSYPHDIYTNMVSAAYTEWDIIERLSGMELLRETGMLQIEDKPGGRNKAATDAMDKRHVKYNIMEGSDFHKVHKDFQYDDSHIGLHEGTTGVLRANKCIKALANLIVKQGGDIVEEYEVTSLTPGNIVTISNGITQYSADSVILAPGSWVNKLLTRVGMTPVPVKTMPGFQFFWKIKNGHSYRSIDRAPVLKHWMQKRNGYQFVYGIPQWEYPGMMKVATRFEPHNQYIEPDERDQIDSSELREFMSIYIRKHLNFLEPSSAILEPCMYSVTDDKHYIIDKLPDQNNIVIAAGMSGHGFHSAPVIGQLLGELCLNKPTSFDVREFSLKRFDKNEVQSKL